MLDDPISAAQKAGGAAANAKKISMIVGGGGGLTIGIPTCLIFLVIIGVIGVIAGLVGIGAGAAAAATCTPPLGPGSPGGTATAEQIQNVKTIIGVAKGKGIPQEGWVVGIATALQESSILNLSNKTVYPQSDQPQYNPEGDGSDHSSLGIFQQQPPDGWGTWQQIMVPSYAASQFFNHLLNVPNWQSLPVTVAAQDVQGSAYPTAYAKWVGEATSLASTYASAPSISTTGPTYTPGTGTAPGGCTPPTGTGSAAGYSNPLRALSPSTPNRVDAGVDWDGRGPIYAIGDGTVDLVSCSAAVSSWSGGCWVSYTLTSGSAKGQVVYVAEGITPSGITAGQAVTSSTVVAMFTGSSLETGWALNSTTDAPLAYGPNVFNNINSTADGANFNALLVALGAPSGQLMAPPISGSLAPGLPSSW